MKRFHTLFLIFVLSSTWSIPQVAATPENSKPREFFESDFVEGVIEQDEPATQQSTNIPSQPATEPPVSELSEEERRHSYLPEPPGTPIHSISLISSVVKSIPEFQEHLEELVSVSSDSDISIRTVLMLGIPEIKEKHFNFLFLHASIMGATLDRPKSVPEKYRIKTYPSWIIETQQGEIVLEGFASPRQFINKRGEFISHGKLDYEVSRQ